MKAIHRVFDQLFEKMVDERVQEDGRGQKDFVDAMASLGLGIQTYNQSWCMLFGCKHVGGKIL